MSVEDVPRIGVQIESGLNIDFGSDVSNDSSSELPWGSHSRRSSCQVPLLHADMLSPWQEYHFSISPLPSLPRPARIPPEEL